MNGYALVELTNSDRKRLKLLAEATNSTASRAEVQKRSHAHEIMTLHKVSPTRPILMNLELATFLIDFRKSFLAKKKEK